MSVFETARHWAMRLYHVDENSKSMDMALLLIRFMVCLCLFYHHGAEKLFDFSELLTHKRLDPIGIGIMPSVVIAGISDFLCCLLVLFGLFSRYASAFVVGVLNVVWWLMDNGIGWLIGQHESAAPHGPVAQAAAHAAQAGAQAVTHAMPHAAPVAHSLPNVMNLPMYILGFLVVLIAGPGRYSLDRVIEKKWQSKKAA